jgi:hypothetical protein
MLAATETYLLTVVVAALIKYAKIHGRKTRNKKMKTIPQGYEESNVTTFCGKGFPSRSTCFFVLPSVPGL